LLRKLSRFYLSVRQEFCEQKQNHLLTLIMIDYTGPFKSTNNGPESDVVFVAFSEKSLFNKSKSVGGHGSNLKRCVNFADPAIKPPKMSDAPEF
jgi:hypothetical protein